MVFGYTSDATFTAGGPTWANVRFRNVIDFAGTPLARGGDGHRARGIGSLVVGPRGAGGDAGGQVLDQDQLTGLRVTVEDVVPWQGGSSVVIRTELPGNLIRAQYDVATRGAAGQRDLRSRTPGTTISVGLQRLP